MIFEAETQATTNKKKKILDVWDEDDNNNIYYIRGAGGVTNVSSKVTERRLTWLGHVRRRPLEHACIKITTIGNLVQVI